MRAVQNTKSSTTGTPPSRRTKPCAKPSGIVSPARAQASTAIGVPTAPQAWPNAESTPSQTPARRSAGSPSAGAPSATPTPARMTSAESNCGPFGDRPRISYSRKSAIGAARHWVSSIVRPTPMRGRAWKRAMSPTPRPSTPPSRSQPHPALKGCRPLNATKSPTMTIATSSRPRFARSGPWCAELRRAQVTDQA